jgi:hypothetical protein
MRKPLPRRLKLTYLGLALAAGMNALLHPVELQQQLRLKIKDNW